MTLYAVVLYAHVLATLVLSAALSFEVLILYRLGQASSPAEARPWINPVPGLRLMASIALLVLFFSGGFLTDRISAWTLAWPKLAAAAVVLFGALAGLAAARLRTARERLHDPVLKTSLGIRIGLVLGLILLMTAKPGLMESLAILGAAMLVGLAMIFWMLPQRASLPAASAASGG
jgi:hypothetical protein